MNKYKPTMMGSLAEITQPISSLTEDSFNPTNVSRNIAIFVVKVSKIAIYILKNNYFCAELTITSN